MSKTKTGEKVSGLEISSENTEKGLTVIPKQEKQVTANDRIDNLNRMQIVAGRYEHLTKKRDELNEILNMNDGINGCKIIIESGNEDIEIKNSVVVGELLTVAGLTLNKLICKEEENLLAMEV